MEGTQKELTVQELAELVRWQTGVGGEFIIHIEPGGEEADEGADTGTGTL